MPTGVPAVTRRTVLLDTLLALGVGVLDVALFSTAGANLDGSDPRSLHPLLIAAYGLLGAAALVGRRRYPVAVLALACGHALVGSALVAGYQPVIVLLVAVYTVGAYRPRRYGWLIGPAMLPYAVIAGNEAWRAQQAGTGQFGPVLSALLAIYTLFVAGVWAVGYRAGQSRRRLVAADRQRAEAAARAVDAERQRISGELHDIVAHAVTVMVLQASGARRVLRQDPDRAATALDQITAQGQQAISELRRLLALLRDDQPVGGPDDSRDDQPDSGPQPGLAELPALLDRFRGLGLTVHWEQDGDLRAVDPSVGLAAYRTVQEALTNVVRHVGRSAQATVRLDWQPTQLSVTVTNQQPADRTTVHPDGSAAGLSTGNGLTGLRERLRLIGGQLVAGPAESAGPAEPAGPAVSVGFQVAATLPVATRPTALRLTAGAGDPT
ncbi:sensor histidine kinase [Micromonospora sp. NBC_01813]|uniref:sensor histidine kinase n=1 Tax=Micromonospora sp. NBC_01813 TaxID=2975988 RepID=UPI002DDB0777|nr:histidine kinase [Micromonospora sp. NBC_01813]WSA12287.1 histidine kinase [Micromonospora sp. NBC_01813]